MSTLETKTINIPHGSKLKSASTSENTNVLFAKVYGFDHGRLRAILIFLESPHPSTQRLWS